MKRLPVPFAFCFFYTPAHAAAGEITVGQYLLLGRPILWRCIGTDQPISGRGWIASAQYSRQLFLMNPFYTGGESIWGGYYGFEKVSVARKTAWKCLSPRLGIASANRVIKFRQNVPIRSYLNNAVENARKWMVSALKTAGLTLPHPFPPLKQTEVLVFRLFQSHCAGIPFSLALKNRK